MEKRPKVGLGVIVVKDGKVILLKRQGAHGSGTWSFPGGHLEYGESWEECAKREVLEETGMQIKNLRFVGLTNDVYPDGVLHYITIFMLSEWDSGEAKNLEPNKCTELDWFEWAELPTPLFLATKNFVEQYPSPL